MNNVFEGLSSCENENFTMTSVYRGRGKSDWPPLAKKVTLPLSRSNLVVTLYLRLLGIALYSSEFKLKSHNSILFSNLA